MKRICLNLVLLLSVATLSACSGSSTQYIDYTPVDTTPKLDMQEAVYQLTLPTGNILTLTTDQSGTSVYGAYTIKNGTGIVSSGKIENLVTSIALTGYPNSPCPTEALSIQPISSTLNATRDSASVDISGSSCSEGSLLPAIRVISKFSPPATARMASTGITNDVNKRLSISAVSGDNVNFVGPITLEDTSLQTSATGIIVGTITDSAAWPVTGNVVEINNPFAYGFIFTRATNFIGHFFSTSDSISAIKGHARTAPTLGGQYSISEISVTATDSGVTQPALTATSVQATQNYTLQ
ncbi:MAG: hypothetical protein A2X82_19295 [Geobacteraceae bacterium GWC2_55_20]|nr:MAG: hypothetical protein A2X82_19295 [Geobacteraceae bacterium GWC2_55_20]OGU26585.1 MAG: hypothetical protein A2X85_07425 [Geobacteraceae bacterium GWF2_54_21]HBA71808.1 hypothetical protein [Geobacter sp.]HCE66187.1 hypothetical protein [Geobacter sp.]